MPKASENETGRPAQKSVTDHSAPTSSRPNTRRSAASRSPIRRWPIALGEILKIEAVNTRDSAEQGKALIGDLHAALGLAYDANEAQETQVAHNARHEAPPAE